MKTNKIIVLGNTNMAMVVKTSHIPVPGERVVGWTFLMNPGGKGALSRLTWHQTDPQSRTCQWPVIRILSACRYPISQFPMKKYSFKISITQKAILC